MAKIHCSISNCHYWKYGNICDASEIFITSDQFGDTQPDNVDALQASTAPQTPVNSGMDSCCKTFVDKNATDKHGVDGIMKS